MGEVVCSLTSEQAAKYMPSREMPDSLREVHQAAGEMLNIMIRALGPDFLAPSCYLVQLNDGRQVAFPFGIVQRLLK